jgi:choline-glycine betaine transporter
MRTASLVASMPLAVLYAVMAVSLVRALRQGGATRRRSPTPKMVPPKMVPGATNSLQRHDL